MTELNFCPYCDAPQHKVCLVKEDLYFCKECNRFFSLTEKKMKCLKCSSTDIVDSDFPSPDGQMVFQCSKCKKMASAKDFFQRNGV